jgi:hypothetical protein
MKGIAYITTYGTVVCMSNNICHDLTERSHDKLTQLDPHGRVDCTAEFSALSNEQYGGDMFGSNATVVGTVVDTEPRFLFVDRALRTESGYYPYPRPVASLGSNGELQVADGHVMQEWTLSRTIDDSVLLGNCVRAAFARSPFETTALDAPDNQAHIEGLPLERFGMSLPKGQEPYALHKFMTMLELAGNGASADRVDAAELFLSEDRPVPLIMHSPAVRAAALALSERTHTQDNLACPTPGILITIAASRESGVRGDFFFADPNPNKPTIDALDDPFYGMAGERLLTPVGRNLTDPEIARLASMGATLDSGYRSTAHETTPPPYRVSTQALPLGTLLRGTVGLGPHENGYRLYAPRD